MELEDERVPKVLLPVYDEPYLIEGAYELLGKLKSLGKQTAILSNGSPQMLKSGATRTNILPVIDQLISVDRIRQYKPSPEVYAMALDLLEVDQRNVVFISSNQWDVSGASTFGLDAVWVNQYKETKESLPFGNVMTIENLIKVREHLEER
jgi:2-haloacid dehalogenase